MFGWFIALFKIGMIAGVAMGLVAMTLNKIKFTTLNLTQYVGALLTGQISGWTNFLAGFIFHLIVSGLLANMYFFVIRMFWIQLTMRNAISFGLVHTLISGLLLPALDKINPSVAYKTIKPMKYFASGYGATAVVTFVAGHVLYAIIVFWLI